MFVQKLSTLSPPPPPFLKKDRCVASLSNVKPIVIKVYKVTKTWVVYFIYQAEWLAKLERSKLLG